jgi:transposase
MRQPVLPLIPAEARPIGSLAGLAEDADGGVVYVAGMATFCFEAGDELARRLSAVQLVGTQIAGKGAVAAAFGVDGSTLRRWCQDFEAAGTVGLAPIKPGPKGPSKLTDEVVEWIRELDAAGWGLVAIGAGVGCDTATVRVALGRRAGSAGWEARKHPTAARGQDGDPATDEPAADAVDASERAASGAGQLEDGSLGGDEAGEEPAEQGQLPILPVPAPRTDERAAARAGELSEAPVIFTEGAGLLRVGLLLVLPALAITGLLEAFEEVYGQLRNGFYGLRASVLMLLFLALAREPRAEGATRVSPLDLGRLLGLDRGPEVKTLRRKLSELAARGKGAELQAALAARHAAARPEALGFLHVDGHLHAYTGKRDLPKTHIARLHMAARAVGETWIGDACGDPVMVVTASPTASLAGELVRLLPRLRDLVGPDRRVTIVFDRGGWSPEVFADILAAGFDLLTYRKAPYDLLPDSAFAEHTITDPETGTACTYQLAETTAEFDLGKKGVLALRQIHKRSDDGSQIPVLTSLPDLPAAAPVHRLSHRWRQENYFKYARANFALDALDGYAAISDDPHRQVTNPAKTTARKTVTQARAALAAAEKGLSAAIDPGHHQSTPA